jgi:hypothetical protein
MSKKIIIRCPLGKAPVIEIQGYVGQECQKASKAMEEALGLVREEDRELHAAYYEVENNIEQTEEQ